MSLWFRSAQVAAHVSGQGSSEQGSSGQGSSEPGQRVNPDGNGAIGVLRPGAGDPETPEASGRDFAGSQRAGLLAAMSLATTEARSAPGTAFLPPQPQPAGAAGPPALERRSATVRPAPVPSPDAVSSSYWAMRRGRLTSLPWPLLAILAVQIVMGARLIWSNTASLDEATYLYAGSQELSHWLHGTSVEDYQAFLSGSPSLYPPIGAIASAVGGLAAARVLSLLFVAGATGLLYFTTKRLFGLGAAVLGTALFAGLGVTQFLSAFATYDPMALFLLALAAYLTFGRRDDGSLAAATLAGVVAPFVLALANATKYVTVLWDPFIVGLVVCEAVLAGRTWRQGLARASQILVVLVAVLGIGLAMGKEKYIQGILATTVDRPQTAGGSAHSAMFVLTRAWQWGGLVLAIALVGLVVLLVRQSAPVRWAGILLFLAVAAALLPQVRIGSALALQKDAVFGAWFGSILAGYALSRILRFRVLIISCACALIFALPVGFARQAASLYHSWAPENPAFIAALRSIVRPGRQLYLIEGYSDIPAYYVGGSVTSLQWRDIGSYITAGGASYNAQALAAAIRHRAFTFIILDFAGEIPAEVAMDNAALDDIQKYGGYRVVAYLPPSTTGSFDTYTVWRASGPPRSAS